MMPRYASLCTLILLYVALAGCTLGIKSWPQPQESQDTYAWRSVTPRFAGDCLIVEGRLDGEFENFKHVRLLAEPLGPDACRECPFKPTVVMEFHPGDSGFEVVGPWMQMRLCGLDTTIPYRLQLEGSNRLRSISNVSSAVVRIDP